MQPVETSTAAMPKVSSGSCFGVPFIPTGYVTVNNRAESVCWPFSCHIIELADPGLNFIQLSHWAFCIHVFVLKLLV